MYWNSTETEFFKPGVEYTEMEEIININAMFKLVQNARSEFT
jgi:hypothetical protein